MGKFLIDLSGGTSQLVNILRVNFNYIFIELSIIKVPCFKKDEVIFSERKSLLFEVYSNW